jgi:4-carboxymuconolactone decarboxylase
VCSHSSTAFDSFNGWYNPIYFAEGYLMTTSQMSKRFSTVEIQKREEYIRARPPRLSALPAEERTKRQQELLDEMSMVVVDGVRKPREDKPALEILLRHAELYKAHMEVAQKFLSDGEMSIRDRELAILRLAWLSQAPYEWGSHVKIAKRNGVTTEEIVRVIEGSSAPDWSKQDRAIVRAIEELHFDSMITDETWADIQDFYNDKKQIELVILAGQYKTVAYYQNSLRLPMPDGHPGLSAR